MTVYIAIAVIMIIASFIQSTVGFGSALISVSLLSFFLPLKVITPVIVMNGMMITVLIAMRLWKNFKFTRFLPLVIGSVIGTPFGVYALINAPEKIILSVFGVVIIIYSLYMLMLRGEVKPLSSRWAVFFGIVSGMMGGAYGTNGPPVVMYLSMQKWKKEEIVVTLQGYFIVSGIFIVGFQLYNGIITMEVIKFSVFSIPFLLTGTFIGSRLFSKMNQQTFKKLIVSFLLAVGITIITKQFI